jgi:YHS domain-containing protein
MHDHNHDEHTHHHHAAPTSGNPEDLAVCPVTGDMVNKAAAEKLGHVREYQGKRYYFCCATCPQLFDKDPQQYVK